MERRKLRPRIRRSRRRSSHRRRRKRRRAIPRVRRSVSKTSLLRRHRAHLSLPFPPRGTAPSEGRSRKPTRTFPRLLFALNPKNVRDRSLFATSSSPHQHDTHSLRFDTTAPTLSLFRRVSFCFEPSAPSPCMLPPFALVLFSARALSLPLLL